MDGQSGKGNHIDKSREADKSWHMLRVVAVRRLAGPGKKGKTFTEVGANPGSSGNWSWEPMRNTVK